MNFAHPITKEELPYRQYIRIESACTMLRNTTLSIAEIAYSCGFNTPSTFNRLFQDKIGMTPGEYRKL